MPDRDTHIPLHVHRILLIVCGMTGLVISLLWWSWPVSVDPLSSLLSRTPLFSRWSAVPRILPVVIDLDRDTLQEDAPDQEASTLRFHTLFEQLIADVPAVIALVDSAETAFLKGLSVVDAAPRAATILLPAVDGNRLPNTDSLEITPNQTVGLRSRNGKLHFNVLASDLRAPGISNPNQAWPFRFAVRAGGQPAPDLALAVASRYRAVVADEKSDDAEIAPHPVFSQQKNSSIENNYFVPGAHRRFFDHYPASALLSGNIPRGTFHNRIVLLGAMSGTGMPAATMASQIISPVASTAVKAWAVLNGQVAGRPQWVPGVEWVLILGFAFSPAVFLRHFSMPTAWVATGAATCALTAGATLAWHLSGIMVQPGAAVLALLLSGLNASLLVHSHQNRPSKTPSSARRPSRGALSALSHGNAATALNAAVSEVSNRADKEPRGEGMASPPAVIAKATAPRERIGRYEILRCIGKGAMGEVFLGRDPHINRLTAIKTLRFKDNFAEDEIAGIRKKFFREAESAGTLSHTNIVTIYDAGEDRERAYIAMEYLEGITLLRFTRAKRLLPVRSIIAYGIQIAEALDYAHRQGIVHRDIKPANIMVLKNGGIKITDFGIARITASSHTQTGVVKGTPYYMSPEQFSGARVDGRSDIFSLGTMLFQLLTGTLPFFSESPAVLMNQIMNFPHPNPQAINPQVMRGIIPIVDKALEKDRTKRYQRAGQMATDFSRLKNRIEKYMRDKKAVSNARLHNAGHH